MLRIEPLALIVVHAPVERPAPAASDEWHDCVSEMADPAAVFDQPVVDSIFAVPAALESWQACLDRERLRPVNAALAVRVIQRIHDRARNRNLQGPGTEAWEQQLKDITAQDLSDFFRAAGLSDEQSRQLENRHSAAAAFTSLATLPAAMFGTCLSSLINAIFPGNDAARLSGFMLNLLLLVLTPWVNAVLAQPVGVLMERFKARHYVLRICENITHDGHSKSRLILLLWHSINGVDNTFNHLEIIINHARAKQVADRRVYLDGRWQQLARYPKTVLAPVGQLLRAARWISAWASAGFQIGASIGAAALQAALAAVDARAQQQFTTRCHLLGAPPLTGRGRERLSQGRPLRARHIDETKLRAFVIGPAEARLLLLERCLRARLDGGGDPAGERALMQADLARLTRWRLPELEPGGTAARWLLAQGRRDPLPWADLAARLQKRGQVSSQFCRFLGQQWQIGIGPAYFVLVPKVLNVASGGHPGLPGMVACAGLSALLGIAGCCAFPAVVIECNEMQLRIDAAGVSPGFVRTLLDAGVALVALPRQRYQQHRFERALAAADRALAQRTGASPAAC